MGWNIFNTIKLVRPRRSTFDLSHELKGSGNMADLIPVLFEPVLPGDSWKCNSELFIRFAPMLAPIMHRVNVYFHYFFVPDRLIWNEFEDFITGGPDGEALPEFPTITISKATAETFPLLDYLGYNNASSDDSDTQSISALRMRAYQLIYNEYYRDQNLEDPIEFTLDSGDCTLTDLTALCTMRQRAWEKDYFTAALPFAQRADKAVMLPMTGDANIIMDPNGYDPTATNSPGFVYWDATTQTYKNALTGNMQQTTSTQPNNSYNYTRSSGDANHNVAWDPKGTLKVDMSNINATTIEELRHAYRLQEWLERNAVGGARYNEMIYAHFGVKGSDARFQRPEYLGGFQSPVVVSEVLQNSSSTDDSAQGNMAGHAISASTGHGMRKFFAEEHGYICAIMSILPRTTYQQGLAKDWTKFDKLDFGWPEFAHLGEQAVLKQEIYNNVTDGDNEETFGWVPRYSEYKYVPSRVVGKFKTDLNDWHLGRIFAERPVLNGDFVHAQVNETTRIFNVTDDTTEHVYFDIYHNIRAKRALPKYGTPMM